MLSFLWSHLRSRPGRTVAAFAGLFLATTGFTVLTGTTTTARLQVTGAVQRNGRAAYDILVRPRGARLPLEDSAGLVRDNYLSGQFGGISTAQLDRVRSVAGVAVAAPIAMVGYANTVVLGSLDLTGLVDRSADRQLLRLDARFLADRGLSSAHAQPQYVYLTRRPLLRPLGDRGADPAEPFHFADGTPVPPDVCAGDAPAALEIEPDGRRLPICDTFQQVDHATTVNTDLDRSRLFAVQLLPDGRFLGVPGDATQQQAADRLSVESYFQVPFLVAGVDPAAEDQLVGLRGAVTAGRYLDPAESGTTGPNGVVRYPVLATTRPSIDVSADTTVSAVDLRATDVGGLAPDRLRTTLAAAEGHALRSFHEDVDATYRDSVTTALATGAGLSDLDTLVQPGPITYDRSPDGALRPRTDPADPSVYLGRQLNGLGVPWQVGDTAFRALQRAGRTGENLPFAQPVGVFDPARLAGFSALSRVPMETYEPPDATGLDATSRSLLGGQGLQPGANPAGYLSSPPLLLTTLRGAEQLLRRSPQHDTPISAIRVRADVGTAWSKTGAERVRLIAQQIALATGLDVDITYGSSQAPQVVELAAGAFGRPQLQLTEGWSEKGVATALVRAVDRKSLVLYVLILVVCVLFLANTISATVHDRRTQLAVLACLGWSAGQIARFLLAEIAALGTAAGMLSLAFAWPVGRCFGVDISWWQALLAVPAALVVALAAGTPAALRAARRHPAVALTQAVTVRRRSWHPRTVIGLGAANLLRRPARAAAGVLALGIGVAALTMLEAAVYAFHGAAVGTVLGDVVSVQVRGVDLVAAGATVLLAAAAVTDVLYLGLRERAGELATLRAVGWTEAALARMVAAEALCLGVCGAVLGAAVGLGAAGWFVGAVDARLGVVAAGGASFGVLLALVAAVSPTTALQRLPTAELLAGE